MTSIGNDIIDLKTINIARTCETRFYSKFLSDSEQGLVNNQTCIPKHHFIWLLWSVKEAAYKCLKRNQPGLVFSPARFELQAMAYPDIVPDPPPDYIAQTGFNNLSCFRIKLVVEETRLYARAIIWGDEVIATIVRTDGYFKKVQWGIKKITQTDSESQSAAVRVILLDRLKPLFPGKEVSVEKSDAGIPFIMVNGQPTGMPVSLSHHGGFVSYSMAPK